jgi:hypothetical protein
VRYFAPPTRSYIKKGPKERLEATEPASLSFKREADKQQYLVNGI